MLRTVDLKRQTETCFFILLMRTSDDGTEVGCAWHVSVPPWRLRGPRSIFS
jgi:hypothetical protein